MAKQKGATPEVIDFTNVKDGGRFQKKHYPEGDYPAEVTLVEDATKKDDKSVKLWLFTIRVKSGTYPYYCNRQAANQAWKIRNLMVATGHQVPKKRASVNPNVVVGVPIGVTLEDEEYEGRMQSSISSVFPLAELTEQADDNGSVTKASKPTKASQDPVEAPQGKKGKGKKGKKNKGSVSASELEALEVEDI